MKILIPVSGIIRLWQRWRQRRLERRPVAEAWEELRKKVNKPLDKLERKLEKRNGEINR